MRRRRQNARLHLAFFLRTPTDAEAEFWIEERSGGVKRRQMAETLSRSEEFVKRTGDLDDIEFVRMAFATIIDRSPGSLTEISAGLARSDAFKTQYGDSRMWSS